MVKDLRSFIAQIESKHPEEIARVTKPISPRYEITALLTHLERSKRFPLLFCEKVNGSDAPVVINVQVSRKLMAFALDCRTDELAAAFSARQSQPISPVELSAAPVHVVVRLDEEVDLTRVPLLTHYDVNAAPYITAGIVVAADPDTGVRNTSYNRLMLAGKRELRIFMAVGRHLWTLHNKAEGRGEPLPIAIVIGVHPLFSLGAQAFTPSTDDEYAVIGGMMGEPLRVAKAKTVPILIPADAEMVIEGRILPHIRREEGPFGEFTGHYSGGRNMTVIRIDRISYRDDPIFEHLYLGMPWTEIDYLMAANTCVPLYEQLKKDFPEVQAVNAMYTHGLVVIVSTKTRYGGFAKAVGMRVLTTPHGLGYAATVIVVDDDVDPFNLPQVMWALSTKMNPAGDLIQVPNMPVLALAPQADTPGIVDKLIIDATTPIAPDHRGNYDTQVRDLPEMGEWLTRLQQLAANR